MSERVAVTRSVWLFGREYDVTSFASVHPGGDIILSQLNGRDCTDAFIAYHPLHLVEAARDGTGMFETLQRSQRTYTRTPMQQDFDRIRQELIDAGHFNTEDGAYNRQLIALTVLIAVLIGTIVAGRLLSSDVCFVLSALSLGVFWQQLAFIGHDIGHNSYTGRQSTEYKYAAAVTAALGFSGAWWKRNHNVHHIHTNSIESDPDIQHLPAFAIDAAMFAPYTSTYYDKTCAIDSFSLWWICHQHIAFYPIMALGRVNLYVQSFALLLNRAIPIHNRTSELTALLVFWTLYAIIMGALPSLSVRLYYTAIAHAVSGIIHLQITLSHFAMPVHHGAHLTDDADDFLRTQFATTCNIDCAAALDDLHGGLQFQIEHHLFPRLPRHKLRLSAERWIRPFAERWHLPYEQHSFLQANVQVYQRMRDAAMSARANPPIKSASTSMLWDAVMARG